MGQSEREAGLRLHEKVFALRQRSQSELSGDAGESFAERQSGALLGGLEAGRQDSRLQNRSQSAALESEHGRRSRRRVRTVRRLPRNGVRLCVYVVADGNYELTVAIGIRIKNRRSRVLVFVYVSHSEKDPASAR